LLLVGTTRATEVSGGGADQSGRQRTGGCRRQRNGQLMAMAVTLGFTLTFGLLSG
jgi:hypothetical protein